MANVLAIELFTTFLICIAAVILTCTIAIIYKARKLWIRMEKLENKLMILENFATIYMNHLQVLLKIFSKKR